MRIASVIVAVFAALPLLCQQKEAPHQVPNVHEKGRLYFDEVEGTQWVRGDGFKASFSADAVSFIPFLGSDAPRNFPVTLHLESVRAGLEAIGLGGPARAVRHGDEITIVRGKMTEIYLAMPAQIEQLFRFDASPGAGAVVVRIGIETELEVRQIQDGSLEFRNERGGVRYGDAVVIDASGRSQPLECAWHDGAIELTVPAAFMADAAFPVTIDPAFVTIGLPATGPSPQQNFSADVAYDSSTDVFALVYEEVYSSTDHDVFIRTMNNAGASVASGYVDFTTSRWGAPRIANNLIAAQFLVVAEKTLSGGAVVIFGRTVQPSLATMGVQFQISGAELGIKSHPDVGGDPSPLSPTYYCVCWQSTIGSNKNVYYNLVQSDSTTVFNTNPSPFLGFVTVNTNSKPSISKSDGNGNSGTQEWIVVYQSTYSPTDEDIYGTRLRWDGLNLDSGFGIDTSGNFESDPEVSSVTDDIAGSRKWLAVYQKLNPGVPPFSVSDYDVRAALFSESTAITYSNLTTLFGLIASHDQVHPCVDTDGTRFTVGFTDSGGFVDLGTPYLATVHVANGTTLGVTELPISVNGYAGLDDNMKITSKHSGGGPQYRYMSVWDCPYLNYPIQSVLGAIYDGWSSAANGGPAAYLNPVVAGCGGLTMSVTGFPALGLGMTATLSGVQGTSVFAIGTPIPPLAMCTGCLLAVDPLTATIVPGPSVSATVPLDGSLVNLAIVIQGADIGSTTGCSGSPSFSLSDAVVVTIL